MKSNIIAKKTKPQYPKNKPLLLTRKAVSASAVYAILDTDSAAVLNNLRVFPSLEEKDAQCRSLLRSQVAVSDV